MDPTSQTTVSPFDPGSPAAPPDPAPDLTGRSLGDFHVLRRLGEGGMGQVYLAEQRSLKRNVALKLLKAELAADAIALQRFKAEAEAVARATHANIVQVYAIGQDAGLHYMALEYVEGKNLREYLAKKGTVEVAVAISIMRQVAAALQRAGELGIVHRDIKPENILLTRKGEVKVADFGLSRVTAIGNAPALNLTQSGVTMGTPLYMSPEQVQGQPLDPRSDIYSFGVTSYAMLAGQPPFRGTTAFEVALQHVQAEPPPLAAARPDLPAELCAVVHKMMAKKPQDRQQTGKELLRDLARVREAMGGGTAVSGAVWQSLADGGEPSQSVVKAEPVAQRRPLRWLPWTMAASVVLALAVGAGLAWLRRPPPAPPSTSGPDAAPVESLLSPAKREQTLKDSVDLYLTSPKGEANPDSGLLACRDLAVFYLDQRRWDEADQLFLRLVNSNQPDVYKTFGRLGHAIVLGLQSKTKESNDLFLELLKKRPALDPANGKPGAYPAVFQAPKIRHWLAEALDYNYRNDPEHFPARLEPLRKPARAPAPS